MDEKKLDVGVRVRAVKDEGHDSGYLAIECKERAEHSGKTGTIEQILNTGAHRVVFADGGAWYDAEELSAAETPLAQARGLLQRARWWVADLPASEHDNGSRLRAEIDAFLAGLSVTSAPRTWTEEQIREAWDRAGAKWSCGVTWETLSRELRGKP